MRFPIRFFPPLFFAARLILFLFLFLFLVPFPFPFLFLMDSSESPFSNLDLWCDWTGDPNDPVEVAVSVEVRCTPDNNLPVLNTRSSSVVKIVEYSLNPKKATHTETKQPPQGPNATDDSPDSSNVDFLLKLGGQLATKLDAAYADSLPDAETPSGSDSGSVIIRTVSAETTRSPEPFCAALWVDITDYEAPTATPNPRKRTAKAASLPDSVPDSEQGHGGCKHESTTPDLDCQTVSSSKHSKRRSLIPRPVSPLTQLRPEPTKILLPRDSAPELEADCRHFEEKFALAVGKENVAQGDLVISSASSPVTPAKSASSPAEEFVGSKRQQDLERLSMVVSRDSPCDIAAISSFPGSPFSTDRPLEEGLVLNVNNETAAQASPVETNVSSPLTPKKSTLSPADDFAGAKRQQDLEELSTVASRDSPCDVAALSSGLASPSSADNSGDSGGVLVGSHLITPRRECPAGTPQLVLVNGTFYVRSPPDIQPAAYELSITLLLRLQIGRPRGWWELIVPGLPRLSPNDHGYVYFRTPQGQGMEFRTTHFKRYNLVESCLMAQFLIPSKLVIPLRPCDSQFYGFLRDFTVTQAIRADIVEDEDPLFRRVKYHAVCSIDLIQRDFWAEKCGFYIWVHGGPQGEYTCHLQESQRRFQTIHLDSAPGSRVGASEVQIICSPSSLGMFVLTWEVQLPRESATTWMPRIRATLDRGDVEERLQSDYEDGEEQEILEVVHVEATAAAAATNTETPVTESTQREQPSSSSWRQFRRFGVGLFFFFLLLRLVHRVHEIWYSCVPAEVTDLPVVSPQEIVCPVEEKRVEEIMVESQPQQPVSLTPMPLRDRIDYFLGWKGPLPAS